MKIGYLFPGQGTQTVGMGKDLYEKYEAYRNIYQRANDLTGYHLEDITFHGPEEQLNQTKYTQIAVLTMSLALLELLNKERIEPAACLGLSLGEYSALICGKALTFEDGIKIIKKRGILMQELCPKGDWHMVAAFLPEATALTTVDFFSVKSPPANIPSFSVIPFSSTAISPSFV